MSKLWWSGWLAIGLAATGCGKAPDHGSTSSTQVTVNAAAARDPERIELIACEIVNRRLPQAECDELRAMLSTAEPGIAAFNVPHRIVHDMPVTIRLAIGFADDPPDAAYADEIPAMDGGADALAPPDAPSSFGTAEPAVADQRDGVRSYRLIVGKTMRAELIGRGFGIKALTSTDQPVSDSGVTTWTWRVTPLERGPRSLILKAAVLGLSTGGKVHGLRPTIRTQPVQVNLTLQQELLDFVGTLPSALKLLTATATALAGLGAVAWALRTALRGRKSVVPPG